MVRVHPRRGLRGVDAFLRKESLADADAGGLARGDLPVDLRADQPEPDGGGGPAGRALLPLRPAAAGDDPGLGERIRPGARLRPPRPGVDVAAEAVAGTAGADRGGGAPRAATGGTGPAAAG